MTASRAHFSAVILIDLRAREPFWRLPEDELTRLRGRFPDVSWVHADESSESDWGRVEGAFAWHFDPGRLPGTPRLRWIHSAATGVRRLVQPAFRDAGIVVTSSRGVHARYMAESALAWMLSHARRLPRLWAAREAKTWARDAMLGSDLPRSLRGSTVLVAGFGATGAELARLLEPFEMRVLAVRRRPELGGAGAHRVHGPAEIDALLAEADIVVNTLPNTDATRGFFNRDRFALMRPGAFFINLGRGTTVDEAALTEALHAGRLSGAGLDVFQEEPLPESSPLWTAPGTQLAPHVAGLDAGVWPALVDLFAENLKRFLEGSDLKNRVDFESGY